MKLTKSKLKQIIKEELEEELEVRYATKEDEIKAEQGDDQYLEWVTTAQDNPETGWSSEGVVRLNGEVVARYGFDGDGPGEFFITMSDGEKISYLDSRQEAEQAIQNHLSGLQ